MILKENSLFYQTNQGLYRYDILVEKITKLTMEAWYQEVYSVSDKTLWRLHGSNFTKYSKGFVSSHFQSQNLELYGHDGKLIARKVDFFEGTPYDIALDSQEKHIWVARAAEQVVDCQDFETGNIIYRLGEPFDNQSILSFPEAIFLHEDWLYISEMGNKRVSRLHTASHQFEIYLLFDFPIWGFVKSSDYQFVQLREEIVQIVDGVPITLKEIPSKI